jgi:uncharacterized protein (TIRG00374 family)
MPKSLRTILQYIFFLGLGILFAWLSLKNIKHEQWLQIKDALQRARHWLIVPAVLIIFLAHYSRAMRWKILMEPLGYKPSNFNTFAAVMIGYLVNAGVPRLGEVVKCTLLSKYENVRADRLVGTIVMERAVDVVCLTIVFASALIFQGHVINEHIFAKIGQLFTDNTGHTSIRKIIIVLAVIAFAGGLVYFLLKRFGHIDAVAKIKDILKGIQHGLSSIRFIQHKLLFVVHTFLIWIFYIGGTTVGIYALQETAHLGIGGGLTTLAIGSIGMIMTPGGIGAYPLLVAKLISWYGIDQDTIGNALGWLLWAVQTLIILVGGLVCFALFSYFNKNKKIEARKQYSQQDIDVV